MARRSRSRSRRNRSYLPHIIRLIAVIAIGLIVYRFVGPRASVSTDTTVATGQSDIELLADGTAPATTAAAETKILPASASTAPPKKSSGWSFAKLFGFGGSEEPAPASSLQTPTGNKIQSIATTSPPSGKTANSQFAPGADVRNPFSNASNPKLVKRENFNAVDRNKNTQETQTAPSDGRTAAQIFAATRAAYQNVSSYSDEGKIALNYRLKNELIAEQQPFSTVWDARNNFYAGKLFATEILCDGTLLSCFMYHIDTENFGNQQLVIPVQPPRSTPPVARLINDQFARNFLAGTENLPLAVPQSAAQAFAMPPALAMLSGQVSSPWLTNGTQYTLDRPINVIG